MRLELLANEILLDLFEFLNSFHLLHGFYDLNYRFNQLLYTHFRFHPLDFRLLSKDNFDTICQQYLPSIIHQITSFCLSDSNETPNQPEIFLSYRFTFNQFSHLQSLSLYSITSWDILRQITFECRDLQYLTHLNIIDNYYGNETRGLSPLIIDNIWNLSKLTHCHLNRIFKSIYLPDLISVVSSSIKYLSIKEPFSSLDILFNLFKHTPYLQQFTTNILALHTNDVRLQVMASSLTTFKCFYTGYQQSMIALLQSMPNLSKLTLEILDECWSGYEWEIILTNHVPNIKTFRFNMDFMFPSHIDFETHANELLDSFRTPFWLDKHRWFVRCHWIPSPEDIIEGEYNMIYTLPYAFKKFHYSKKYCFKSTCPNERDYFTYNCVQTILNIGSTNHSYKDIPPFQFPHLRHCSANQFLNDEFWKYNPFPNKLTSLSIGPLSEQIIYDQLQTLVDKAPHLYSLLFNDLHNIPMEFLQLTNTSIRTLDFINPSTDKYFNHTDCVTLVNSSLGQQCEYLLINIENRIDILYLIKNMSNLRSLFLRCADDRWTEYFKTSWKEDELCQWLHDNLASVRSITRNSTVRYSPI